MAQCGVRRGVRCAAQYHDVVLGIRFAAKAARNRAFADRAIAQNTHPSAKDRHRRPAAAPHHQATQRTRSAQTHKRIEKTKRRNGDSHTVAVQSVWAVSFQRIRPMAFPPSANRAPDSAWSRPCAVYGVALLGAWSGPFLVRCSVCRRPKFKAHPNRGRLGRSAEQPPRPPRGISSAVHGPRVGASLGAVGTSAVVSRLHAVTRTAKF